MKTCRLSTAGAIVEFLKVQFTSRDGEKRRLIEGVWGIFGHGNVAGLGQALNESEGLPFYQGKNEQAMVHAAVAFAKARRRLQTMACTSSVGPGATNMVTGAATATINRLPVLLLPGDYFANRRPAPVLQQLEHPLSLDTSVNDCFRPVSKFWDRILRPEQILTSLPEAIRVLSDPAETGAVTLALPQDVQAEAFDFPANFFEPKVYLVSRPTPAREALQEAADLLRKSEKPLAVLGGGIHYSEAHQALKEFLTATGLPAVLTQAGMGALTSEHLSWLGSVGVTGNFAANRAAEEADLILAIGTRLSDFTTASKSQFKNPSVKFINLNVCARDAHKHGGLALVGDAREGLSTLMTLLSGYQVRASHKEMIAGLRSQWQKIYSEITQAKPAHEGRMRQAEVISTLNEFIGLDGTVVHAAGGIPGDIHKLWRSKDHSDYHSEYGYSCMGYEIAGALGVKMAHPEREVYAFLGDGSYLMMHQELVTSLQEGLKVTVILNDNSGFQCIKNLQMGCGGDAFGNEFLSRTPEGLTGSPVQIDFMANAASLGLKTFRARHRSELLKALEAARNERASCFIYVPVDSGTGLPSYSWWDVPVAQVSTRDGVQERRKAYEKEIEQQKFYY